MGRELAPWMAEVGAIGVHAYTNVYTFWVSDFPNGIARCFFESHCETDSQLIAGKTHGEAHRACKAKYQAFLDDPTVPEYIKSDLFNDMNGKAFYGNPNATIVEAPPPPPETATIIGTVTQKETGAAIQGATVRTDVEITQTNQSGNYALTVYAPESYTVTVEARGYKSEEKPIHVEPNQQYILDFQLEEKYYILSAHSTPVEGIPFKKPLGKVTPFEIKYPEGALVYLEAHHKAMVEGKVYFWDHWGYGGKQWKRAPLRMWADVTVTAHYRSKKGHESRQKTDA